MRCRWSELCKLYKHVKMETGTNIYLSSKITCGPRLIVAPILLKIAEQSTFSDLLEKLDPSNTAITSVLICKNDKFIRSECQEVALQTELAVCRHFSPLEPYKFISFIASPEEPKESEKSASSNHRPNAFSQLMKNASALSLPAKYNPSARSINKKEQMFNDILALMQEKGLQGWHADTAQTIGARFVESIVNVLWYLDPHHDKLKERGAHLPRDLQAFHSYNNWQEKKQARPSLEKPKLESLKSMLGDLLLQPWISRQRFKICLEWVEGIVSCLEKYIRYLDKKTELNAKSNTLTTCIRNPATDIEVHIRERSSLVALIPQVYKAVSQVLSGKESYQPVDLGEFAPTDRFERRSWLNNLQLHFPVSIYRYQHGNALGTQNFVWRIPDNPEDRDETEQACTISKLNEQMPKYSTRAMKRDYLNTYYYATGADKSLLRNIFKVLTRDEACAKNPTEAEVDERVMRFLVDSDVMEDEIVHDLRRLNGNPNSTQFDVFWDEVQAYFNEVSTAVNDRRHGKSNYYLPFALSIEDLRDTIKKRIEAGVHRGAPIPSAEWLRLQFCPLNPYARQAIQYTGRFQLKFKVQQRLIRKEHVDSKFGTVQYNLMKQFALMWREDALMMYVDDKATVPIGEPEEPLSTGVRGHNKVLVPVDGPLAALDHDWHTAGVVPSVAFIAEIPESASDSFYNGKIYVTTKDRVFMPSSPNRHGAETLRLLRDHYSSDGISLDKKILLIYSDGGPDHRVTYGSVQVAMICMFLQLDVDFLAAVRTCPGQSWINLAERCMSLLNLCLQGVALMREKTTEEFERKIASYNTMKELRSAADKNHDLKEAFSTAMEPVIDLLNQRFERMKLKGENMVAYKGMPEQALDEFFATVAVIDSTLESTKLRKADLESAKQFSEFVKGHCKSTHYTFQIKKCVSPDCRMCTIIQPPRLPREKLEQLHFLPDPVLKSKESYKSFEEVYGKATTEKDRPSLKSEKYSHPADEQHRRNGLFVSAKIRGVVVCGECQKSRCIFSNKKLSKAEEIAVAREKESGEYDCGSPLFNEDHPLSNNIVVMQSLRCASDMEPSYYSANVKFPDCCFYCGQAQALIDGESEYMKTLKEQYAVVRPLCSSCRQNGKSAAVRAPKQKRPRLRQ